MKCKQISELVTPCLLIDKNRLVRNIERMSQKAQGNGVVLRPHIKTHKCIEIAKLQRKYGCKGLTVSTLDEASVFADAGFKDITYAVPIASNKISTAVSIAERIRLMVLIDSLDALEMLDEGCKERGAVLDVLLKVDCGYHRCGVDPSDYAAIKLVQKIVDCSNLRFSGILTHAGHSYDAKSIEEVKEIANQEQYVMVDFANRLEKENDRLKPEIVSIGSTPTISLTEEIMEGITEIRPGNYVFYDYTQVRIKSCRIEDCALTVLARVIGKYHDHLVIDAGATALSKDLGPFIHEVEKEYGKIYADYETHSLNPSLKLDSISQEHGKIKITDSSSIEKICYDSMLRILPNHSCLTANLHDAYLIMDDSKIVDQWKIQRDRPITSTC